MNNCQTKQGKQWNPTKHWGESLKTPCVPNWQKSHGGNIHQNGPTTQCNGCKCTMMLRRGNHGYAGVILSQAEYRLLTGGPDFATPTNLTFPTTLNTDSAIRTGRLLYTTRIKNIWDMDRHVPNNAHEHCQQHQQRMAQCNQAQNTRIYSLNTARKDQTPWVH